MKEESREIEERLFDRIENLYSIHNKQQYKFELAKLELELLEYYLLTGKKHQIELNLMGIYARMWKMR